MLLWKKIAEDSAIWCSTSATQDIKYVESRFEHEGFSFLTITLPAFGKDFEKSLDRGCVDRNLFQGFTWQGRSPLFLKGFLDRVFDRSSGELLDCPEVGAILSIRQLTLMFGKVLLPTSNSRFKAAMTGYIQCERDVRDADAKISSQQWDDFRRVGDLLFGNVLPTLDDLILDGQLLPKHGPGATADKLRGNTKYRQRTWPSRLEVYFPSEDYILPNDRFSDHLSTITSLDPEAEVPVRVISVPKTQKTPRIIGIEPTAMMYCQQAVLRSLLSALGSDKSLKRMIGFKDQEVNHRLAHEGSLPNGRNLATLDLSEASDRVSNQHVRELLAPYPHLHGAVDACRSRKADVDGHGVVRLAKFASMGSALCFPMEAMVFLTMIFVGIEQCLDSPLSARTIQRVSRSVRVYGDDIIVPVDYVQSVIGSLESFGIRVNRGKSFWNGKFRESCGKEFYEGSDVSIVRVRRELPTSLKHVQELLSAVSLRNQLYQAGYWGAVRWLDDYLWRILKYFPRVLPTSPVLGRFSFLGYDTDGEDPLLHRPFVKGYRVKAVLPPDNLEDHGALLKCLLSLERNDESSSLGLVPDEIDYHHLSLGDISSLPTVDDRHLERAGRPQVRISLRKGPPF
jgi:hypothetical protein